MLLRATQVVVDVVYDAVDAAGRNVWSALHRMRERINKAAGFRLKAWELPTIDVHCLDTRGCGYAASFDAAPIIAKDPEKDMEQLQSEWQCPRCGGPIEIDALLAHIVDRGAV